MAGVWSGFLTFGLVTLPVRLHAGARGESVAFHLLHASDRARLKQQMVCTLDGEVVGRDQTVRGYEYARGEYVVISNEEIKSAAPPTQRQLEILEFCRADELDPLWFESSYYLLPEPAGLHPYALLLRAMRESSTCALSRLTMHNREYLGLIRPTMLAGLPNGRLQGLLLHTLYYSDELRVPTGFGSSAPGDSPAAELKLARQLIAGMVRRYDPSSFHDRYRKNLEAVVQAALAGKPAPAVAAAPRLAPVANLMQSLKASLAAQSRTAAKTPASARRKPARPARRRAA
ncbi:MAG: Ku protein [Streptosporangiaceae bacterium]